MKQEAEEQQDNVEPCEEQSEEKRPLPLAQSLTCGVSTFLVAGMVDAFAHLGPTGLVVGGITAYVASQHGPELLEQVRVALPTRPSRSRSKRSILDRTFGWFPEGEQEDMETILVADLMRRQWYRADPCNGLPAPSRILFASRLIWSWKATTSWGRVSTSSASREAAKPPARWRG